MPPDGWIYKNWLDFKQPLDGRRIKLKSVFTNEKSASMFLYYRDGKYYFKDFSSGEHGDAIELSKQLLERSLGQNYDYKEVVVYLKDMYREYRRKFGTYKEEEVDEYFIDYVQVCHAMTRSFNANDITYWSQMNIREELLKTYNVKALKYFKLGRKNVSLNYINWYDHAELDHVYGIYNNKNELIKIYAPFNKKYHHITIQSKTLGYEQLENHSTCIIGSSMKDMLTLKALKLKVDVIWPSSEKTIIPKEEIDDLKQIYPHIFTMFDNDPTGVKSMCMYKTLYDLDFIYVPGAKDIADMALKLLPSVLNATLTRIINKKLETCSSISTAV